MIILITIILFLTIVADVSFNIRINDIVIAPRLSMLFLLYLGFRQPFTQVSIAVVIFVILAHPFTGLGFAGMALSYWGVLYIVCRLRRKMFAESYLTHAAWIFLFSWLLQWLLDFELKGVAFIHVPVERAIEISSASFAMMLLTVPLFLFWDALFDSIGVSRKSLEV